MYVTLILSVVSKGPSLAETDVQLLQMLILM